MCRLESVRFRVFQGWTASLISFFPWWSQGKQGVNISYTLILLRPALIIFGLIGGYVIFGAAMYFFSSLFNFAVSNTQQDIANNSVGAFGIVIYTMIFTFLTYNIALMCFKMIDDVPKGILRWMGSGTQTFGDSRGDPISGSREVIVGAVAGGAALKQGLSQSRQSWQKAKERHTLRKAGKDPDNLTQNVNIIGQDKTKGNPKDE